MRSALLLCLGLFVTLGCSSPKPVATPVLQAAPAPVQAPPPQVPAPQTAATNAGVIVTPSAGTGGKIALVNVNAKYVVVSFPIGEIPGPDQRLGVFRNGLKVGELKVTGPQRDFNTVADVVDGDCHVGDEVR
jgi:hypothetical protein